MKADAKKWDERYEGEGFFYGTEPNAFLKEQVGAFPPGGQVLCLAEGEGRNAVFLAERGFQVTAVDVSSVGLEKLRKLAADKGVAVKTVVADLEDFDLGRSAWDGIVSIWAHVPQDLRRRVHQRSLEALRRGGVFLLEAYTPKQLEYKTGGPPTRELLMTLEALQSELSGLELVHAVETERTIHEGKGHNGRSAVVQVIGKKL
ncbi:MAG: class I SAM-dependent methyltransferase [Oligoflexia bacterium]|nr:class I SAM-dependent methyltransferase [Oligoflexia bacterium]